MHVSSLVLDLVKFACCQVDSAFHCIRNAGHRCDFLGLVAVPVLRQDDVLPAFFVGLLLAQIAGFCVIPPITNPIRIRAAWFVQTAPTQQRLFENAEFIGRFQVIERLIDFPTLFDGKHMTLVVNPCGVEGQIEYQSISRGIVATACLLAAQG